MYFELPGILLVLTKLTKRSEKSTHFAQEVLEGYDCLGCPHKTVFGWQDFTASGISKSSLTSHCQGR